MLIELAEFIGFVEFIELVRCCGAVLQSDLSVKCRVLRVEVLRSKVKDTSIEELQRDDFCH